MNAGGQKRTLFQLSAVHKNTLTLVMDIKEENKDTIGRALAVGYRASRIGKGIRDQRQPDMGLTPSL